jgi:hypothetical protein
MSHDESAMTQLRRPVFLVATSFLLAMIGVALAGIVEGL